MDLVCPGPDWNVVRPLGCSEATRGRVQENTSWGSVVGSDRRTSAPFGSRANTSTHRESSMDGVTESSFKAADPPILTMLVRPVQD